MRYCPIPNTRTIIMVILLFAPSTVKASPFQFRSATAITGDSGGDFAIRLKEEIRLNSGPDFYTYHSSDFGVIYQGIGDNVKLGFFFKLAFKHMPKETTQEQRPHINLYVTVPSSDIRVGFRSRLAYRYRHEKNSYWWFRNRFKLIYANGTWSVRLNPYVFYESFISFTESPLLRNRIGFGLDLNPNRVKLALFYFWEKDVTKPEGLNVAGVRLFF